MPTARPARRPALLLATLLALLLGALALPPAAAQDEVPSVLAFTGTYGFRHPSIADAQQTLLELDAEGVIDVHITEAPAELTALRLREFDVLMFVSTTGKPPLTQQQQDDVIRFAACGGGTVGFHAALDSNYGWAEYAELFGAQFDSHPQNAGAGAARMVVEDRESPITEGWHDVDSFMFDDEYYRWRSAKGVEGVSLPRELPDVDVLLSLDETTVAEGIQEGPTPYEHRQPIAWTKTFRDRGRVYYNNMGHSSSTWSLPEFRTALVNGVRFVAEVPLDLACYDGETPLPPGPTPPAADPASIGSACTVPALQPRNGPVWEQSGEARALTAEGDTADLDAGLAGGLAWGAQTYVLDLADVSAATADVTLTLSIPNPADDYDLSVTTPWGWYGSDRPAGTTTEQIVIEDVPHCAYLHVAGDNMAASGSAGPTLTAAVEPGPAVQPPVEEPTEEPTEEPSEDLAVTRIVASPPGPSGLAAGWSQGRTTPACRCALLARDDDFADALASGAAQATGAPLLLTAGDTLSQAAADRLVLLGIERVTILGGLAAVGEQVEADLAARGIGVDRIEGATRIETAVAVAEAYADELDGVPLLLRARGSDEDPTAGFADALAAGREAARGARPVLLTDGDGLSRPVADHLTRAGVREVVVVGGPAAVGEQVEADLAALGVAVRRVEGTTRAETAVAVARELSGADDAAAAEGVLLLDATDPDSWAEGFAAAGAHHPGPVVLADGDALPDVTAQWLGRGADVPLTCAALVSDAACDAAASALAPTAGEEAG
jgi:type 1 glutamine amidotransferase